MFLIFLTTIALLTAKGACNVDPAKFACSTDSPSERSEFSIGTPPVDLTHIFCGNIGGYDGAMGFHARPGNNDPPCAVAEDFACTEGPLDCFGKMKIYDSKNKQWVVRTATGGKNFCFFPTSWSKKELVNNLQALYLNCKGYETGDNNNLICGKNFKGLGFDVVLFLKTLQRKPAIATGFPVVRGQYRFCDKYCDASRLRDLGK